MAPEFETRDARDPAFWDERFDKGFTPWDLGAAPQALRDWGAHHALAGRQILIPGCGAAHELAFFVDAGAEATAIDFSPSAVERAAAQHPKLAHRIVQADFFSYAAAAPLDLIYERAFLCALPRALWPQIAQRWAQLLAPGALLAGFFYYDPASKGPPFGSSDEDLCQLLAPNFERIDFRDQLESVPVFAGKESWQVWRRR